MGTTRETLPSGHWIELADPHELLTKHYKLAMSAVTDGTRWGQTNVQVKAVLAQALIANWDYNLPLPATPDVVDRLPIEDGPVLHRLLTPAFNLVMGISVTPTPDGAEDEESPTGGSSASEG